MHIICIDLEGVLIPEIWMELADVTGLEDLKLTTRDIKNYEELMDHRLSILSRENLDANDLIRVVAKIKPFKGARKFLDELRTIYQVVILSDTFYELSRPLFAQLGYPTVFCHHLEVTDIKHIEGYTIRLTEQKLKAVEAFKKLNFSTIAIGDSYNDISMLQSADLGILFNAPDYIKNEFQELKTSETYVDLLDIIKYESNR